MLPDLSALDLANEAVDIPEGVSGEEFFAVKLPDDGDHYAHLVLGDRGISTDRQRDKETGEKTGPVFLNVHLVAELYDDEGQRQGTLFDNPTSIPMQRDGGTQSKLVAILAITNNPPTGIRNLADLKAHTETVLGNAPEVIVVSRWEASAKAQDTEECAAAVTAKYAKRLNPGDYYTFLKGQRNFPETESGGNDPEVTNPITGETIRAQARIVRYKRAGR